MGVGDLPLRWGKEQWRIQGRDPGPPPFISLFLDQTKARMAEKKNFLETPPPPPPYLKVWTRHWKNNPRLRAILQPRHPGVHFFVTQLLNGC